MALSLCLLLDADAEVAVRRLWRQLAEDGLPSMARHTHGRHVPHLTLATLGGAAWDRVPGVLAALPEAGPTPVVFQAFGSFTRTRCSLLPAVPVELMARHARIVEALLAAGLEVHHHYLPGAWLPHLTIATRSPVEALPRIARRVYEMVPLPAVLERLVVVDTHAGEVHELSRLV